MLTVIRRLSFKNVFPSVLRPSLYFFTALMCDKVVQSRFSLFLLEGYEPFICSDYSVYALICFFAKSQMRGLILFFCLHVDDGHVADRLG